MEQAAGSLRHILVPLALAQFVCSFAGSNMDVMINDISKDLDTTGQDVQTAITVFLLVMAALMIPGGKLTDRWVRKRCFTVERLAKKHTQRTLIIAGYVTTIAGVVVLLALVNWSPSAWALAPGLLLIGLGVGVMLTPSVNVVQSAFLEEHRARYRACRAASLISARLWARQSSGPSSRASQRVRMPQR